MYPNGYQYTQFKKYLNEYKKRQEYSYHNVYIHGEEMQIDYAGDKLYIRDKSSGTWVEVVVLCCVMPYSSKAFAMGAFDSTQENLFHCHKVDFRSQIKSYMFSNMWYIHFVLWSILTIFLIKQMNLELI